MKKIVFATVFCVASFSMGLFSESCVGKTTCAEPEGRQFVKVDGHDLVKPDGTKLYIVGTNLGNWLNPEGYMFGFQRMNSPRLLNELFCELVGPEKTAEFWKNYKDNYITKEDIDFIASTGANTIRLPFHYKLFTDEDYMGLTSNQDGFERIDSVVDWCRANNLYLVLDMHDAPGGQTGDNIDDSYGYPWLLESPGLQQQFCNIWREIAEHYKSEPVVLGYELINEPVATYFDNRDELNAKLLALYEKAVAAIREVDPDHIILIGAPQWNSNFEPLKDFDLKSDPQLMLTCHRYGGDATTPAIANFIAARDEANLPMYMGEIGHNTDQWQADFVKVMKDNNIGYTFWPYKKRDNSCMVGIVMPEEWEEIMEYAEAPHHTFAEIREANPDKKRAGIAMEKYLEQCKFKNCVPQVSYITSMGLRVPGDDQASGGITEVIN